MFKRPDKLELVRECSLANHVDRYLAHLLSSRYKRTTLRTYAGILLNFAGFVDDHEEYCLRNLSDWIDPFLMNTEKCRHRKALRCVIRPFVRFLQREDFVSIPAPASSQPPFWDLACEYETFLVQQRNLARKTVRYSKYYCLRFLQYLHDSGIDDLSAVKYELVQRFIQTEAQHYSRVSIKRNVGIIRGFLSYLKSHGRIPHDFARSIIAPKTYKHERCPKYLTSSEIHAIICSVDRRTRVGKRDYAMLLLLATYGLRSKEAVQLKLEDIEWRQDRIHVRRRKAGNNSVYPLTSSTGEAILSYLKNARPPSHHRKVFLTCNAPYRPICRGVVWHQLRKYLKCAGLDGCRASTHTFRYSCAQRLFDDEVPVKVTGDYLGHHCLSSTQRYMKIDIKHLRQVATGTAEDML